MLIARIFASLFTMLPVIAFAQSPDAAGDLGYQAGYIVGFYGPIVVIVAVVVLLGWLIFRKPKRRKD